MAITLNGAAGAGASTVTLTDTQTLTNKTLTSPAISDATFSGQQTGLEIAFSQSIVFEGTTADSFETTLTAGEPTADRTITLPDATGTVALAGNVIANSLLTTTGDIVYASSANTPARLGIGTSGQTLSVSAGGIVEWTTPSAGTTANDQAFAFAVQVFA
jgi:hypothetical protein